MSDLVGNPEDRFSHNEAQILFLVSVDSFLLELQKKEGPAFAYEPRCEKTGLRGFRPGPTQTKLYNHRR